VENLNKENITNQIKEKINTDLGPVSIYNIQKLENLGLGDINNLPYSLRILLESIVRQLDGRIITKKDIMAIIDWKPNNKFKKEIPFIPSRIILQDLTGIPSVVDLAALRSAMKRLGDDPSKINPIIPADLIIDHSIQVDCFGTTNALEINEKKEFERNHERYLFLKWAQSVFNNFRVIPPSNGIVHQINLEYLASVVQLKDIHDELVAFPDTVLGTDSHTTMINGLGVLGWGVGGIEAEAVMLGQPYYMNIPEVVGVKLIGEVKEGITATDIVLTITQILRTYGVVGKFIEFYGSGLKNLNLADRATIANMAPEYGATMGFFPIDNKTLEYLILSGRKKENVNFIEQYLKKIGLFHTNNSPIPQYSEEIEINLSEVESSLAGPKRPQDRIPLRKMKNIFYEDMNKIFNKSKGIDSISKDEFNHGSVVIAAITSCTNTSNPSVIVGAGLLAKKAVEKGLKVKKFVKTSFAPGSRVVADYLKNSGLLSYLETLGFHIVGYGCTTCLGNSGPLSNEVVQEINGKDLVVAAVLSGNRNFEGRINPYIKANYLASPQLVIAFALAGTIAIDLESEPLGYGSNGTPVYLKDLWPSEDEIQEIINKYITPKLFKERYSNIFEGKGHWKDLKAPKEDIYQWDQSSTYIREPPFFINFQLAIPPINDIKNAKVLAYFGDSITTDHISPAGSIPSNSAAGKYLISNGVDEKDFNSFGSRRGNHEVMMRGTFGNIRIRNKLVSKEGGWTKYYLSGEEMPIYDAAMKYKEEGIPLVILAGQEYGTGSSRDWAAKGTELLGIKAVIAESFERIHRNNLVGMGVLPLQFMKGDNAAKLGLKGDETFDILGIKDLTPFAKLIVKVKSEKNKETSFKVITRLDTQIEIEYYRNGGILPTVLRSKYYEKNKK
jgi:aconitate hydratase